MTKKKHEWENLPRQLNDITADDAPRRLGALLVGASNGGLWNEHVPARSVLRGPGFQEAGDVAFTAWLWAASSAEPDESRWADAAVAGALVGAGKVNLEWLTDDPRFGGEQFATPAQWAQADWDAQWEGRARQWAAAWTAKLPDAGEWLVVRRMLSSGREVERGIVERLTWLYPGVIEGDVVTIAAPQPVAEWVKCAMFHMGAKPGIERTWAGVASPEEHSIAVRLWATDADSSMVSYDAALEAARAVLS